MGGQRAWTSHAAATVTVLALVGCGTAPIEAPAADQAAGQQSMPVTAPPTVTSALQPSDVAAPRAVSSVNATPVASAGSAFALLATLEVKGRAPTTGYDRDQFGPAWTDVDRNGCDTRNDVLQRDLTEETFKTRTRNCVVMTGQLADPYTGRTLTFTKAQADAIHIDHVVSLSNAWQTGALHWEPGKRMAFANDPLNLLAVDGPTNASKGDGDAATWLPPNKAFRCAMVARQTAVKAKYRLWVTAPERDALGRVLSSCPAEPAPAGGNQTVAPVHTPKATAPVPASAAAPPPRTESSGNDPDYGTCKEAKANRAGPYHEGRDPEYEWYRDADSDGVACE